MDQDNTRQEYNLPHKPHHFITKKVLVLGITFLLTALIASIGAYYVATMNASLSQNVQPSPAVSPPPTSTKTPHATAQWLTYMSNNYNWEIQYPPELEVRVLPAEQTAGNGNVEDVNFFKVGKTQAEGTEFYDGLSLTVSIAIKSSTQSLRDFADKKTSQDAQAATRNYFREITVNNLHGYEAQIDGLGVIHHIFLPYEGRDDLAFWISYMSVGPDQAEYDTIVQTMIDSFNVTMKDASQEGMTMCTMDAKVCSDGSTVGRQGPNCEFAACPGE